MTSQDYKKLISESYSFDYATLQATLKELVLQEEFELTNEILRILTHNTIEKPKLHTKANDDATNYYKIDLTNESIEKIIVILSDLEVSHVSIEGETTPTASFYASLVDKWTSSKKN